MNESNHGVLRQSLRMLSDRDFLAFGVHEVAYIKPVQTEEGRTVYSICSADGKPVLVMDNKNAALAAILHNNLEPVTLQ